jgi:hypothetical protein
MAAPLAGTAVAASRFASVAALGSSRRRRVSLLSLPRPAGLLRSPSLSSTEKTKNVSPSPPSSRVAVFRRGRVITPAAATTSSSSSASASAAASARFTAGVSVVSSATTRAGKVAPRLATVITTKASSAAAGPGWIHNDGGGESDDANDAARVVDSGEGEDPQGGKDDYGVKVGAVQVERS